MKMGKLLLLILLLGVIVCAWYFVGTKRAAKADELLKNHVKFSGNVIAFDKSLNHSYGIVKMKVVESNIRSLNQGDSLGIFPYRIKGEYAEFYGYIPINIKVGQSVLLDSDEKSVKLYEYDALIAETELFISSEEQNIRYVGEHSSFR